jgi:RimJ/RimL family protein N-acetyltransferase
MQYDALKGPVLPVVVKLRDGREVTLRAIQAQDRAELLAAFHRLSDDSRYTRFMAFMRDPPEAMLEAVTHPAAGREFTVVAISGDDGGAGSIVGSARYVGAPGSDTCEFAVTVADDWHGLGLARRLMEILIDTATAQEFRLMEGYVLAVNTPMRQLAKNLGFADTRCHDDAALRVMILSLAGGKGETAGNAGTLPA